MKDRGVILDATLDVAYRHPSKNFPPSIGIAVTAAAHRRGVMISTGTDDNPDWNDPDSTLVDEIVRLVQTASFTTMDALKAATTVAVRTIGQQEAIGKLEPGYVADFVVLNNNSLDNIQNLRSVEIFVKHGIVDLRKDYVPFRGLCR